MFAKVNGKEVVLEQFRMSESLIYALKSISKDSENDIVTYFYNIGLQLFNDVISRKRLPQRCDRKVKLFYKETGIQVRFDVWSSYFASDWDGSKVRLHMTLSSPQDMRVLTGADVANMMTEIGLGLSDNQVTTIEKPQEKTYKCLTKKITQTEA